HGVHRASTQSHAGMLTFLVQKVEVDTEVGLTLFVQKPLLNGEGLNPSHSLYSGILWMSAPAHLFDAHKRSEGQQIRFATPSGSRGTGVTVDIEPGAQNGGVAHPAGNFPREAACGCRTGKLTFRVHAVAINGSPEVLGIDFSFRDHFEPDLEIELATIFEG